MNADWHWQRHSDYLCLAWPGERRCLSSGVLNGGLVMAERVLNLKVSGETVAQAPDESLQHFADRQGWTGTTVGLMTAASMNSLRTRSDRVQGEDMEVLLTCGLSNARRAGDPADWREDAPTPVGTINLILITSASLSVATQVELLQIVTEAKAAALQALEVRSPLSGLIATGTGTDASVIVAGEGREIPWAGKHTPLGERAATLVMEALEASIREWP